MLLWEQLMQMVDGIFLSDQRDTVKWVLEKMASIPPDQCTDGWRFREYLTRHCRKHVRSVAGRLQSNNATNLNRCK
jgi:hypothetical protein